MINKVLLVGRLTKDPDLRMTTNGKHTMNFSLACNRKFKDKDGNYQADFINCVCWNQQAQYLAGYAVKGDLIGIEGTIQTRTYENTDGKKVYITEVLCEYVCIVTSKKKDNIDENKKIKSIENKQEPTYNNMTFTDDDLPFM